MRLDFPETRMGFVSSLARKRQALKCFSNLGRRLVAYVFCAAFADFSERIGKYHRSEQKLDPNLQNSGIPGLGDHAEQPALVDAIDDDRQSVVDRSARILKLRVVENVEGLQTQLQSFAFRDVGVLQ